MGPLYAPFLPCLQLHTIDAVIRQSDGGADASGAIVTDAETVYTNLPSTNDISALDTEESYGQQVMMYKGVFYVAPLPDGTVPAVRRRDLIQAGTWPAGGPRLFVIDKVANILDNNSILVIEGTARAPT